MSARLLFLGLLSAASAFGQYLYDYSGPVTLPGSWTQTGAAPAGSPAQYSYAGSLIWNPAVSVELPGGSSNDYEVNTTLALAPFGGTYIEYLRASSNAEAISGSCAGSYISLELVVSLYYASGGMPTPMNLNQCVGGSLTHLGSFLVTVYSGSTFRTVVFGTSILVYLDNQLVVDGSIPATTGQPGIGGYGMSAGSGFTKVSIGHHDTVAPNPVLSTGVRSSILPTQVSLAWQGTTDDTNGIGVAAYYVTRGVGASPTTWVYLGLYPGAELTDSALSAGTTYTYLLYSFDFHGNTSAATNVVLTTPPATSVDPRREGVFTTGAYWGGGGEQIDMLSGNLNFSLPLVAPQGRTGWTVPVGLSYNSQNWRQDSGTNWELGTDVGYGYGWNVQIGSITPYYIAWPYGVDHYVYTDGTGAQYRLDQNSGNIWSSLQGIYVWFDGDTQELHFKNGMLWLMGDVSSGAEQDAGTLYPTIIEDAGGNQLSRAHDNWFYAEQRFMRREIAITAQGNASRHISFS